MEAGSQISKLNDGLKASAEVEDRSADRCRGRRGRGVRGADGDRGDARGFVRFRRQDADPALGQGQGEAAR